MLEFNTAFDKEILVIELEGALDSHSATDFRSWFNEKIAAGYRAFAIDCLCLEFISSAGITALIDVQNILQNQNGKVVLFQLSGETRQLLRFLQLERKIQLVSDYDDAIAALTGIKKVTKPQAPAMVELTDLKVLPGETEAPATPEEVSGPAKPEIPAEEKVATGSVAAAPVETAPAANAAELPSANEMVMEENFSAEKKGLHPMAGDAAAVASGSPVAAEIKSEPVVQPSEPAAPAATAPVQENPEPAATSVEAQEIRVNNTGAKRLISCPNCKSVLRVATAGEYLCPACRFRFAYKASA